MDQFAEIIAALERGEFVNAHGRSVAALPEKLSSRVRNMISNHNIQAMRRRKELVARLQQMKETIA